MTSDLVDDSFSMMDPEIDELADDETDKVLMEVAGIKLSGMSCITSFKIDMVDAAKGKREQKDMESAYRVTSALPDIPM